MKDILFRAKRIDNDEWVYGYPFIQAEGTEYEEAFILGYLDHRESIYDVWKCAEVVDPKTICRFTGLFDKNGTKIFEGDIIKTRKDGVRTEKLKGYFGVDSEGYPRKVPGYDGVSEYHYSCQVDYYAPVEFSSRHGFYLRGTSMFVDAIHNEVVGNIHDNPEMSSKRVGMNTLKI